MSTQNKSFQSPRGTHDILPSQIAEWRFVEEAFREVCARYNYQEIRTPLFEQPNCSRAPRANRAT
jgi:histidyl-tRNA synthetase